ncbi:hypothetical protein RJ640_014546 [Escallonia rubra]|uniref:Retrotransposon gag domain-containing protein n=1 Tax=Escallonia rubra TaxID=112253 RepID=A0AA88R159_9ASTE|nr:hypothetical protein RJ640_014546 [Escallonia rubra]
MRAPEYSSESGSTNDRESVDPVGIWPGCEVLSQHVLPLDWALANVATLRLSFSSPSSSSVDSSPKCKRTASYAPCRKKTITCVQDSARSKAHGRITGGCKRPPSEIDFGQETSCKRLCDREGPSHAFALANLERRLILLSPVPIIVLSSSSDSSSKLSVSLNSQASHKRPRARQWICVNVVLRPSALAASRILLQKKKKKTRQETDIIKVDEHLKVHEVIIPGPHGAETVVLSIDEDIHIQEEIKKNETVGKASHIISAAEHPQALGMVASTSGSEQLAAMSHAIENLTKTVEEKDLQIANLMNKLESKKSEESKSGDMDDADEALKQVDTNEHPDASTSGGYKNKESKFISTASLSIQQLQEMIANTIKAQYGGPSRDNLMYSKPYTKSIDNMRMPAGYQPPKFQQFDGKGNPRQHVAHFIETCNDAGTEGDFLVKQFVRSLKGNAFDWYTDLEPESIDCWEEMEREFHNRFYSTRRSVIMMELTNTKQRKEEHVVDYINRWRALSLDCKERLSEASAVEMCMQGMHWGLLYILQGNKPRTFEELATRGHNMEITISSHGGNNPPIGDPCEDTREARWWWGSKATIEDSMVVTATPLKTFDKHKKEKQDKKKNQPQGRERQQPKFKELEQKVYPFSDSKVRGILDFLLEHKLIDLPKMKRVEEAGQVNESRYCKYHRLISHPTEKCFTLKEVIMDLSKKGKIHLDGEGVEESNTTSVIFRPTVSSASCQQQKNGSPEASILGASKA